MAFFLIKILPASPLVQIARAAIIAQCRTRDPFQLEGTSLKVTFSNLLLQARLTAVLEQTAGDLF